MYITKANDDQDLGFTGGYSDQSCHVSLVFVEHMKWGERR